MRSTQGVGRARRQMSAGVRGITRHLRKVLVVCSLGLVAAGCTREPSSPTARASDSDAAHTAAPASTAAAASVQMPANTPPPAPDPTVLRVCADPGNMPLSNKAGEGFQNKIAQVVADAMGRRLEYEWRTYYQRGLARSTINAGRCDLLMDLNSDFEQGLTTRPLYRSAYVLVTRKGLNLVPTSLDDPALKKLRLGVFQSSPARQALYEHGISGEVQYLFYDSATAPEEHPGKLVERVAANELDAAESWGPVAGYYAARNSLGVVPLNTIDDAVLEYSMAWAVSRKNAALRDALNTALQDNAAKIAEILRSYHVPLVRCSDCIVAGDLPSHGPYTTPAAAPTAPSLAASSQELAQLQLRIADGADPNQELAHALDAGDAVRAAWLLRHGADANTPNLLGEPPLHQAIRNQEPDLVGLLLDAGARLEARDASGWTALMKAAWANDADSVTRLVGKRAPVDTVSGDGWSALDLAVSYADASVVQALLAAGANVKRANAKGFTPVMFAVARDDPAILDALLARGADVGHANQAGVTALMLAAAAGRDDVAKRLLAAGADPAARNRGGKTAATLAQDRGDAALAALLSEARRPARR
ncbi:quinoprotein dehydrogenase-associated putative ABC transporter substrate-binding protein [Xanthomonas vesicatoria]|uniref:quinoprotein dehydrogenase-associated putative ABC transporter substrate-binding protein n=1 Tax=Xanthomonas vesicatoria TaxID=56460 RepID=UPI0007323497|nr:quinoprotein dehydrogenase-associated putative ABC transporter substrate-binding protein [Xanthomonas vesicatoria]KTF37224.1 MoxJ protein [Xanthomonas vesicatoria]MCC8558182.1 quinoprotein dehydrogenase-associated putative ABC transporter substrate-binding protein [Xanthomonas vesicatoria]MCC8601068.1 quinoprotein dehydrogenase-associated putative ABC transporter substrate-binding protein [Xanthomonas vesicatoria]MCC8609648.1 quinoprotein dehydrogenase-associated putative ABC transporter sub